MPSLSGAFLTVPPCRDLVCLMSRALFIGPIIRHLILCLPCPALIVVVVIGDLWVLLWREQRSGCLQLSSVIELAIETGTQFLLDKCLLTEYWEGLLKPLMCCNWEHVESSETSVVVSSHAKVLSALGEVTGILLALVP